MRHWKPLCALACTALLTTLFAATGCGSSPSGDTPGPSPATTSPEDLCTALITKWGRQIYDSGKETYGDYQSMGLSNGQYMILRDTLDLARAERERHGADAGRKLLTREARERCEKRYRHGQPSGGPWV
ncbi:hypothetical protein GCM10009837_82940 [Streptomyces durmitorensis]|uniref:Lipoprotein n=1 Tax=Streptomyces durmitorensis TaxID=319947 RepID=A0ABY4Q1B8_9ACTN|nr:hypothetical protein [Streptomyces durmitorensis]UQT59170.1 hypothetical protein M4V62_31180 [Streptomyces durmitorensis]